MSQAPFTVQDEIQRLLPVDLELRDEAALPEGSLLPVWDQLIDLLTKIGKQQFRTGQGVELLADRNRDAIVRLAEATELLREQADAQHQAATRLGDEAEGMASKAVEIIDTLDDLALLAREGDDLRWLQNVERLQDKVLRVLEGMGITPIPAAGEAFDPEVHEALDTVERGPEQQPYEVVSVLQRGFRFRGRVLRPVQVITTRP